MEDSVASTTKLSVLEASAGEQELIRGADFRALIPGRLLGEGASAHVFVMDRGRILKRARPGFEAVLLREARALTFCGGHFAPRLLGLGELGDGGLGLLLESKAGTSLSSTPTDKRESTLASAVLLQGSVALVQLHAWGLRHGDVKPDNLVVSQEDEGFHVSLIDFGLATSASSVEGGTVRYLPPALLRGEVLDASAVDAFGLARSVAEILDPELAQHEALEAARIRALPEPFGDLLGPILAPENASVPGVRWLWEEARSLLGETIPLREEARIAVRREYLATRSGELETASSERENLPSGPPGDWIHEVAIRLRECARLARLSELAETRAEFSVGSAVGEPVSDLSPRDRQRFLGRLLGPSAISWSLPPSSDERLIEVLRDLGRRHSIRATTRVELHVALAKDQAPVRGESALDTSDQTLKWALQLGKRPVELRTLLELARAAHAPGNLRLEAARAARSMGELALAERLLKGRSDASAELERAQIWLREGRRDSARALLEEIEPTLVDPSSRSLWGALLARLTYDRSDYQSALRLLSDLQESGSVLEVRALAELALGRIEEAHGAARRGEALAESDEERARLMGVCGMIHHRVGEADEAREAFMQSVAFAARAGAALEEATFSTGVAAAASDGGHFREALAYAERAECLFEALDRPQMAARALLARAAVLSAFGAGSELKTVVRRGILRAQQGGDQLCEAYLHMCLSDALTDLDERRAAAKASFALLTDAPEGDRLRAATRLLLVGEPALEAAQGWADSCQEVEAKIEWYRARAESILKISSHLASEASRAMAREIISHIKEATASALPLFVLGPALLAAGQLALRVTLADDARQLLGQARKRAEAFLEQVPSEYRARALELLWVKQALGSQIDESTGSAQLSDVEGLLRALSQRRGLRAMLDQILDLLLLWTGVERGLLLLRAPGGKLVVRAARNLNKNDLEPEQRALSQSMAERALSEGRPVVLVDAMQDMSQVHRSVHALNLRSVLAVPLTARGEVLGVAYLDDKVRRGAFGERELGWVNLISTVAAITIADEHDRLRLERSLRRTRRAERKLSSELSTREAELELAERELNRMRDGRKLRGNYEEIIGRSATMTSLLGLVDRVAFSDVPVLIQGESGTGKELIARAIAMSGNRKKLPFVAENCSAVPESLLESTLFGHQKGAFTGASRNQTGLFELAHKGTLFLDEIGDMSLPMQTKLLRVLQEGEVRPLGAERVRKVDVRVIVATHRDLKEAVDQGRFREDLYYRLNVVTLNVPALRQRRQDIVPLVQHFIAKYSPGVERKISPVALDRLVRFAWPGNVRQLENEIRRLLVLGGEEITAADLSPEILGDGSELAAPSTLRQKVDALERRLVLEALEEAQGNRTRAAESLGLSRFGLQKMTQRLGIDVRRSASKAGRIQDRGLDETR